MRKMAWMALPLLVLVPFILAYAQAPEPCKGFKAGKPFEFGSQPCSLPNEKPWTCPQFEFTPTTDAFLCVPGPLECVAKGVVVTIATRKEIFCHPTKKGKCVVEQEGEVITQNTDRCRDKKGREQPPLLTGN